jgi:hypothetical protein
MEGVIHNPSDIYLRVLPDPNGQYQADLSHVIEGILHSELIGAWVDYTGTTAGSEAVHSILCVTMRGVLQAEIISNFCDTDSIVIPVKTANPIGGATSRFYAISLGDPVPLSRSTAPVGKGLRIKGQVTFFNRTTLTSDLMAPGTIPAIYLHIRQRAENFRV